LITFEADGRFGFRNPVETRRGEAHQEGEGFYDELIAGRITDQGCFATDEGQIADRNSGGSRTKETLTSDEIKK
jgi:hypothetical protein